MGGKTSTVAQSDTAIGGLKLQSSIMGGVKPLMWGRSRIASNLLAYYDFTATPHTSTTSSGGKGGSPAPNSSTSFSYQAAVLMALCASLVRSVVRAWKDKLVYGATQVNSTNGLASDTITVPDSGLYQVALSSVYKANVQVRAGQVFVEGRDYTHDDQGRYAFDASFHGKVVAIDYLVSDTSAQPSALPALGLELAPGYDGQPAWGYLESKHPDQAITYSGLAYLRAAGYDLGTNAEVGNHNFEVSTFSEYSSTVVDADPARVLREFLTDGRTGALWPTSKLGDLTAYSQACIAQGLFISPVLDTQRAAADWVTYLLALTNADCIWSEGQLKVVPLLDSLAGGNGVTYTPNTTPVYDLGEEHFLAEGDEPPVAPHIKPADDCMNQVRVEFYNRGNNYNIDVGEWKDEADIVDRGLRTMEVIEAHAICEKGIANYVATIIGQRQLTVRRTFTIKLPWTFSLVESLDLVTITDSTLGLFRLPVRINRIEEDEDNGFTLEVEEAPIGLASAPRYGSQQTIGFAHDFNVTPGSVLTPFFFEPPIELTTTGLEVWAAVTGPAVSWGGAVVWASTGNSDYRQVGRIAGGSRYGALTASFGAGGGQAIAVQLAGLGGLMLPATAIDAEADQSLTFVGDSTGGEFFDYEGATLTGPKAYSLDTLHRGRYGSNVAAHAAGQTVVRVDQAIAKSDPLPIAMIGSTLFFKFTSFNVYGGGGEDLADVVAYPYTITGAMLKLPPSDVAQLNAAFEGFAIRLSWPPIPDQDVFDYLLKIDGTSWDDASPLAYVGGASYLWAVQVATPGRKVWIKARDQFFNESRHATLLALAIPLPQATNLVARITGPNVELTWQASSASFAIDHYLITAGPDSSSQAVLAQSLTTLVDIRVDYLGARTYGVAVVDVAGNVGPFAYAAVNIQAPGAPIPGNAGHSAQEVIDNNVLLYWTPPNTGSLPVDHYDVRRGPTFAAGTPLGSNGNSTFSAIFEQASGDYIYWIAAVDTAGNVGPPIQVNAKVNQPPDFVLRSSIDSGFAGASGGMYGEVPGNGHIYGPSFRDTFESHFLNRSWATVQDQLAAGYPLYFEPSATSCWYEEVFDYGVVLSGTTITSTVTSNQLSGSTTMATQISYKVALGDPWINASPNTTSYFANNFRFVKIRLDFTASGGDDLIEVLSLNVRLSVKRVHDGGKGVASASDASGTYVAFNKAFVDAETPTVQPNGTTALIGIANFLDAPYPTGFAVFIFDLAGNRVNAPFSWAVDGTL